MVLSIVAVCGILLLIQLFYPSDRLLPFTKIDNLRLGAVTKSQATSRLNEAYEAHKIEIYLSKTAKPFVTPTLKQAGIAIDNTKRLQTVSYPWWQRLIPTSILWGNLLSKPTLPTPTFGEATSNYIDKTLMPQCRQMPTDAGIKSENNTLTVVPAVPGGKCERAEVERVFKQIKPSITQKDSVTMPLTIINPEVNDDAAKAEINRLVGRIGEGVAMQAGSVQVIIPKQEVYAWVETKVEEGKLKTILSADKSLNFLEKTIAPKVTVQAGVSRITTVDFTEKSRLNGAAGRALDQQNTLQNIENYINENSDEVQAATIVVPPKEEYTRTYSATDTGLSALLTNYAKDHKGTYGISLIELDGRKRRANFDGDKQFTTASTYKLFVAYSLLKRVDSGSESWGANQDCFNKMISLSDNACAEMLLEKVGRRNVTKEINAIGLSRSNFSGNLPVTTANDLTLFTGMLEMGQNFSTSGRDRLVSAMRANIFRQGIPAGVSGTVADKVGFMDGLLHDAAIVYSPNGRYVLAIMSDGSSWATLADLARQIDVQRAR